MILEKLSRPQYLHRCHVLRLRIRLLHAHYVLAWQRRNVRWLEKRTKNVEIIDIIDIIDIIVIKGKMCIIAITDIIYAICHNGE